MTLALERVNAATPREFGALLDDVYEQSPWVAERAAALRPFGSLAHLKLALIEAVRASDQDSQLALIRAHAGVIGTAAVIRELPTGAQAARPSVGSAERTPDALAKLRRLDAEYEDKFGFPFLLALHGPRGCRARAADPPDVERGRPRRDETA